MSKERKVHRFGWLKVIIIILLIAGIIYILTGVAGGVAYVQNSSMNPWFKNGDIILFNRLDKEYAKSDIVLIQPQDNVIIMKRIIALEGDIVDIDNETGVLYINGKPEEHDYIKEKTLSLEGGLSFPATVSKDCVFVLSDDRDEVTDSRQIGMINTEKILGKVIWNTSKKS